MKAEKIAYNSVMLTGGCACNKKLQEHVRSSTLKQVLFATENSLNCDNGAMIAWMGHELRMAGQDVDIRGRKENGHTKIPLGNFVKDLMRYGDKVKSAPQVKNESFLHSQNRRKVSDRRKDSFLSE